MYYIDNIKYLRKTWKYSQKDMAELLETTQQQYSKYENKQQELPIRHLITICEHFSVSSDWVLGLNMNTQKPVSVYDLMGNKPVIVASQVIEEKKRG